MDSFPNARAKKQLNSLLWCDICTEENPSTILRRTQVNRLNGYNVIQIEAPNVKMKRAVKLVLKPRLTSESKKQLHEKWCADIDTTIKSVLEEVSEVPCWEFIPDSAVTNWKNMSLCSDFVALMFYIVTNYHKLWSNF